MIIKQDIEKAKAILSDGDYLLFIALVDKIKAGTDNYNESIRTDCINIIVYLNNKTGKLFVPDSKTNIDLLKVLMTNGYSKKNIQDVIDYIIIEWKGKEYEEHIKPITIFNLDKFTKYFEFYNNKKIKEVKENNKGDAFFEAVFSLSPTKKD